MIDSEIEPLPALPGEGKGIKQAEVALFTFAEACAKPSAKRFVFHGSDGPANAVEVDGTFFVQNDEAEAKAARSKALELASEVTVHQGTGELGGGGTDSGGSARFRALLQRGDLLRSRNPPQLVRCCGRQACGPTQALCGRLQAAPCRTP